MPVIIIILMLAFIGNTEADELWTKYDVQDKINCITRYGNFIWIGTNDGIVKMNCNNGVFIKYTKQDSLFSNTIHFITSDVNGNIFAATKNTNVLTYGNFNGGISLYDGYSWKTCIKGVNELAGKDFAGLKSDNKGVVWIAVQDGYFENGNDAIYYIFKKQIQCYDGTSWKTFYVASERVKAEGNWRMHFTPNSINSFDIVETGFYAFTYSESDGYTSYQYCPNIS